MDRATGNWDVPAAMLLVLPYLTVLVFVPIYDMLLAPFFVRLGRPITRLWRQGIGLGIAVLAMLVAGTLETIRLQAVRRHNLEVVPPTKAVVPISIWWQIPQYLLIGIAEVFTSTGGYEFFYSQVPTAMRSVSAAIFLLATGLGSYWLTALVSWN